MSLKSPSWSCRPKEKFTRAVSKQCPKCKEHIPVACKTCPCGNTFVPAKKNLAKSPADADSVDRKIRRTERVRRERPDFYNSLAVQDAQKRQRMRNVNANGADDGIIKRKRGRPKGSLNKPKPANDSNDEISAKEATTPDKLTASAVNSGKEVDDVFSKVTPDKEKQYSLILDDINQKCVSQNFKPV